MSAVQVAHCETDTLLDEEHHVVCCEDDLGATAFCGVDVAGHRWVNRDADTTCVVCEDLERSQFCPRYGTCPK